MVGYDHTGIPETYQGELKKDRYGKKVPKAAHGSVNLGKQTSSTKRIMEKVLSLYDRIVDPELQVRRMSITANHVIPEGEVQEEVMQYSLFDDVEAQEQKRKQEQESLKKEHQLQEAILSMPHETEFNCSVLSAWDSNLTVMRLFFCLHPSRCSRAAERMNNENP